MRFVATCDWEYSFPFRLVVSVDHRDACQHKFWIIFQELQLRAHCASPSDPGCVRGASAPALDAPSALLISRDKIMSDRRSGGRRRERAERSGRRSARDTLLARTQSPAGAYNNACRSRENKLSPAAALTHIVFHVR